MHLCRWFQLCSSSYIPNWFSRLCVKLGLSLAGFLPHSLWFFPLDFEWSLCLFGLSLQYDIELEIGLESHLIVNERVWCLYMRGCNRNSNLVQWALPFLAWAQVDVTQITWVNHYKLGVFCFFVYFHIAVLTLELVSLVICCLCLWTWFSGLRWNRFWLLWKHYSGIRATWPSIPRARTK